jgi:hypothetical protein
MFSFIKKKLSFAAHANQEKVDSTDIAAKEFPVTQDAISAPAGQNDPVLMRLQEENEIRLIQLVQIQEQLETTFLSEQDLKLAVDRLEELNKKTKADHQAQVLKKEADYKSELKKVTDDMNQLAQKASQLELEKKTIEQQAILKTDQLNDQLAKKTQALSELEGKYKQVEDQKKQLEVQHANLLTEKNKLTSTLSELKKAQNDVQRNLEKKLIDQEQQNELLLLQMHQLQEEVEELFLDKQKIQQSNDLQLARWNRLEKNLPNYIHFEKIELLSMEEVSDQTVSCWRIYDYYQAGTTYEYLDFNLQFKDGNTFIGLGHELDATISICPRLVPSDAAQQKQFRMLSSVDWKKLSNISGILSGLISNRWAGLVYPKTIDLSFCHASVFDFVGQFKKLPQVMRYARVALKRELHNIDYEHLWLEISGVEFGNVSIPKLDMRIGATLVRQDGFSRHPKFEFPLINRKDKPFESWYPESNDDQGPKYEVRFDLDRNAFDLEALKKLSNVDRALVLNLIMLTPKMVEDLIAQRIAIHRPWVSWLDLANETTRLISLLLKNTQTASEKVNSEQEIGKKPTKIIQPIIQGPLSKSNDQSKSKAVRKPSVRKAVINGKKAVTPKPKAKTAQAKTSSPKTRKK